MSLAFLIAMFKELLSVAAIALTFALFVPYIRSIQNNKTKPHIFSWVIWGLGTLTVFFAQLNAALNIHSFAVEALELGLLVSLES